MSLTTREIRKIFLDYFKDKQHNIVTSAPIVLKDDPTLMFTNAGMNQFKGVFVGNESAAASRVADTQKCLRVSGKHNDLEEVGKDHYHHTMFEMLGNWSFGDYFKKEAIAYAWELLVHVYKLDPDRIYVSVFQGDDELGVAKDDEAASYWKQYLNEERILNFGRKDNFWEMGETGPCGPCSEIHYDMRSDNARLAKPAQELVNQDDPEVIEIWNLVFMQYSRLEDGSLLPLKEKHIDTGMGLERLARALQGKVSNYDIDLFASIISKIEQETKQKYSGGDSKKDIAFRVIADHLRAISFCIADGQLPSSSGAGYVVRRVLRRAIRYGYSELGMSTPFIYMVFDALKAEMGEDFPELIHNETLIKKVIQEEEQSFLLTLAKGLEKLNVYFEQHSSLNSIDGSTAFELYDTFGFPIDLTQLIAQEHGKTVDMDAFNTALQEQKERSRKASKASFGDWTVLIEGENSVFVGYDATKTESRIAKFRKAQLKGKEVAQIVLDQTPFYAESGGQVGDKGTLNINGERVLVFDTKKENNEIVHYVDILPKNPVGIILAEVDVIRRNEIKKNHSATHLLHLVLRNELGKHVEQKGSLVNDEKLRFDFSHYEKIDDKMLRKIEEQVNQLIAGQINLIEDRNVPLNEAKARGAMALFGEKYGNTVRVIQFGDSVELCGGTHVANTAEILGFKLVSEGSVASGVRRIEAITGNGYQFYVSHIQYVYEKLMEATGNPKDLLEAVLKLQEESKQLKKKSEKLQESLKQFTLTEMRSELSPKSDCDTLIKALHDVDPKIAKDLAYQITIEHDRALVILVGEDEDKPYIVVALSKAIVSEKSLDASKLVRELAGFIDGGGGGQPFLATAGGKNKEGLRRALERAHEILNF
jgi:alanyl-tRNA synthetase